jgi:hypothetical protein
LHFADQRFELRAEEFNRTVAGSTDDMVVLETVRLVPQGAIPIIHGTYQTTLCQQPQRPVDRRKTNARIPLFNLVIELVGGEMLVEARKTSEYHVV